MMKRKRQIKIVFPRIEDLILNYSLEVGRKVVDLQ